MVMLTPFKGWAVGYIFALGSIEPDDSAFLDEVPAQNDTYQRNKSKVLETEFIRPAKEFFHIAPPFHRPVVAKNVINPTVMLDKSVMVKDTVQLGLELSCLSIAASRCSILSKLPFIRRLYSFSSSSTARTRSRVTCSKADASALLKVTTAFRLHFSGQGYNVVKGQSPKSHQGGDLL